MPDKDSRYRFLLEKANVRVIIVQLDETWKEVLRRAEYPRNVQRVLSHAMVAVPLLASTIKFDGRLTLQARGSGPVKLLVVQAHADGGQRGLAQWVGEPPEKPLQAVLGDATLTLQIESGKRGEVYQGVVEAKGDSLQDAIDHYFENSEQLPTRLWLHYNGDQAAGLLLQQLPLEPSAADSRDREDDWRKVSLMAATVNSEELLTSDVTTLLPRVFSDDDVRLLEVEPLRFACGCSRERTSALIQGLGYDEAKDILQQEGQIEIICEFCNSKNVFDSIDVETIFRSDAPDADENTVH
ncbi:hypothetical protein AB833_07790 [Chromatiales bacterium (ex Bugula neritina AB1)]|nr:hypothetical protein AB833_07790 [Chromatiales bacterium (ex Bugula neritina AB1)]